VAAVQRIEFATQPDHALVPDGLQRHGFFLDWGGVDFVAILP
jgi:hypothetical protein